MEDIKRKSTIDLIKEYTKLEKDIEMSLHLYEKIRVELCRRYPNIENEDNFKPKVLVRRLVNSDSKENS